MKHILMAGALTLALGVTPIAPVFAQNANQPGSGFGMMGGGCPMLGMMSQGMMGHGGTGQGMMSQGGQGQWDSGPGMMGDPARMGAVIDGRLAYLKSALGITAAQADLWNNYADAVEGRVGVMQGVHQSMIEALQKGTAPDRMNARIDGMEAMLTALKDVKPATDELYSALSSDQKKLADQLIGMDCGGM